MKICFCGQETEHVKIGHVKIDRAHFRVHFREHWKISCEHSHGSLRGDPLVRFTQTKPQPSWAFPWTSSWTLLCAFSWALSWESSWVKFRGSRALRLSAFSASVTLGPSPWARPEDRHALKKIWRHLEDLDKKSSKGPFLWKNSSFIYVFFLPPLFCQRIPAFWTQSLGKNRLISANVG